jgi:hypothetical protein
MKTEPVLKAVSLNFLISQLSPVSPKLSRVAELLEKIDWEIPLVATFPHITSTNQNQILCL